MAESWQVRADRIIAEAEAARAAAQAAPAGPAAPMPGAIGIDDDMATPVMPRAVTPDSDWQARSAAIIEKAQAGTLPVPGAATPSAPGYPPHTYDIQDAAVHGATFGLSDQARGAARDLAQWRPWGSNAAEIKEARDKFATEHPYQSIGGNIAGGVAVPIPFVGAAGKAISQIPSAVGRWAAGLGLGSAVGAGAGAVSGAVDEAPLGVDAALEGAERGAKFGAMLGPAAHIATTGGLGLYRFGRQFLGPQTQRAQTGMAGRMAQDEATNPDQLATVGEPLPAAPPNPPNPPPAPPWAPYTPREQLQQRIEADAARVDPEAGVLLPGQAGTPARPTVGQLSEDPGIRLLEDQLVANILKKDRRDWTPAELELFEKTAKQSEVRTAAARGQSDPGADPMAVKSPLVAASENLDARQAAELQAAAQRGETLTAQQEANLAALESRLEAERNRLGQNLPAEERGAAARGETAAAKTESKAEVSRLYEEIDPTKAAVTDQSATVKAAADIRKGMLQNDAAQAGKELELFDKAAMQGKAMPLAETLSLRSQIMEEVRRIQRDPNENQQAARRLTMLRQELDKTLEPHVAGLDADTAARYRTTQDAAKEQAQTFKNDTVGPILQSGANAEGYRMLPEQVATKILQNNSTAEDFLRAGGNPETLRGALVDDLYRHAKGQPLTEKMLETWRSNRQGALRVVPELASDVANVGRAQTQIDNLVRTQKAEGIAQSKEMSDLAVAQKAEKDAFERGAIGRVMNGDPGPNIAGILVSRNANRDMMLLRDRVGGDADAQAGMKKAVVDYIVNRFINPQSEQINPAAFRTFLTTKAGAIETAVGADGMKVFRAIVEDLSRSQPGKPQMGAANKGGTPSSYASLFRAVLEGSRAPNPNALIAPTVAAGSGKTGWGSTAAAVGTLGVSKLIQSMRARGIEGPNQILAEAVNNPAAFRAMMMQATPDNLPLAERALQAALATGRQAPTATFDYGKAEERTERRARERLLAPAGR